MDGGKVRLTVRTPDGEEHIEGSHLLSAIGRVPDTEALAPAAVGLRLNDHGHIEVDEYLETSVPGVYAMGDVKGGPAFTHLSYDDYRVLKANLLGPGKVSTRDRIVPYTMFIDPQLGRVGVIPRPGDACVTADVCPRRSRARHCRSRAGGRIATAATALLTSGVHDGAGASPRRSRRPREASNRR